MNSQVVKLLSFLSIIVNLEVLGHFPLFKTKKKTTKLTN